MPLYEYTNEATGERVELIVPIAERDAQPGLRRIAVPPRLNMLGVAEDIHSQAYGVRQGLRELEEKHGADRIRRDTGMTVQQLRHEWAA